MNSESNLGKIRFFVFKIFPTFLFFVIAFTISSCNSGTEEQHPIEEFLFGYEEEGFVFYPISHRNYFFVITSLTFFLLFMVVGMLIKNRKSARILKGKNDQIGANNLKITSSIQYAQRIQQALLPTEEFAKSCFKDAFVLYEPRDIVSGDFLWVSKTGNQTLIAAIDCTGHGVPGAFLTIMAHQELSKIVFERKISAPKEILFELHKDVQKALGHNQDLIGGDGMDLGICLVDSETRKIQFAGANLPLLHATKDGLVKIKANKLWIGSPLIDNSNSNPFFETSISFSENDVFYMFSDGFADQFGGQKDRKFLQSNLQNLLAELCTLPMPIQKIKLREAFLGWKGSKPQTDDILGLGFKI